MKKFICLVLAVYAANAVYAQDAAAIVDASRNRITVKTLSSRSRMVLTAKDGKTTERLVDQYSKDDADGNSRLVIVFQKPAAIAGTRFLTISKKQGNDDSWIYLPALSKVRRIAASEGSSSFMGTDLSFDDISSADRAVGLDDHKISGEEKIDGNDCYKIESIPKDKAYQYSKMILFIDKSNKVCRKMELYDKKGVLVKLFEIKKLEDKQGRLTPMETTMSTIAEKTSTTIYIDKVEYDSNVPESVFTTRYLETGKP
jgi:outer membrane lipoprotein-sorting protein